MKVVFTKIRRVFLAGLFVSLPLVVTVLLFKFVFEALDNFLGPAITSILSGAGVPLPEEFIIPGIGVVATLALVFFIGIFTTNWAGRKLWDIGEWMVERIPVIRTVYTGAKQVIDTFATNSDQAFRKVVMLEYPRKGIYCLAFITGKTKGEIHLKTGKEFINIFLPTTPNPTSGFFLMIPKEDLIELEMSVEDGIKMIVSGGVVTPEYHETTTEQ